LTRQSGVNLIELMITIAIAAIIFALALAAFQTMMAGTRTKSTAESILSGLRYARSEAIKRNVPMRFQLVSSLDGGCAYSTTSPLWVVTQTDQNTRGEPIGQCDAAPFTPKDDISDPCNSSNDPKWPIHPAGNPACASDPYIAYKSSANTLAGISVEADSAVVTFGPLGQVLSNIGSEANSMTRVDVTSTTDADATPWSVIVASGGSLKMCNAGADIPATSPLKCP
jgi:prepilin-type N-terminal cleavage/methylation domain-containing protein